MSSAGQTAGGTPTALGDMKAEVTLPRLFSWRDLAREEVVGLRYGRIVAIGEYSAGFEANGRHAGDVGCGSSRSSYREIGKTLEPH